MDARIQKLLEEFVVGLRGIYGGRLRGAFLYGSRARGEAEEGSDADMLIVLDRIEHYASEIDRTGMLCAALSLHYDVSISRVFVSEQAWQTRHTPFLENVRAEALSP